MGEDGWYEEQVKKMDEESKLSKEKSTKSMNLFTQKQKELRDLSSSKMMK